VATDEIIDMTRRMLPEVQVNEEAFAIDIIREVGPGAEFVTHPHTLNHFREVWYSDLLYRGGARAWNDSTQLTFEERVNGRTRELIESHQSEPLPEEIFQGLNDIIKRAEAD
jgi:trimethylamine--corrinoid protein Co-methyltransferase